MNKLEFPHYFTNAMRICYSLREELQHCLPKANSVLEYQQFFAMWWLVHGPKEYPKHFQLSDELISFAREPIKTVSGYLVTRFMDYVLKSRNDVSKAYSTSSGVDIEKFIAWYYAYGLNEYGLTQLITEKEKNQLAGPNSISPSNYFLPLTNLMYLIWKLRPDLQKVAPLLNDDEKGWLIKWFYIQGVNELKLLGLLTEAEIKKLNTPVKNVEQNTDDAITYLMYLLWSYDDETNQKFDLNDNTHRKTFGRWFNSEGIERTGLSQFQSGFNSCLPSITKKQEKNGKPFGVNLIGYATGDLGIGEDVRMMAKCLEKTDIPFCVINHKPRKEISQSDKSIIEHITKEVMYDISIFCMTGIETMNLWLKRPELFSNNHNIGYWPWELPKWPEKWSIGYQLVDEIWASSRYTQKAFSEAPIPVQYMPMAVSVDRLKKKYTREHFNLPLKHFLFTFVFDFMSYLERKNPFACINAFKKAFPKGTEKTSLVLKISNAHKENKELQKIETYCARDKRIILINETFTREKILGLFDVCSAYVSLHRSEGFGRTIAEALLLGKPVIATNFSGNVDFVSEKNAYPVEHTLKKIKKGDYPGGEDQSWADVSITDAVKHFKMLYSSHKAKQNLPININLADKYHINNCAEKYSKRLKKMELINIKSVTDYSNIYFLHIHKSVGTSFVNLAQKNSMQLHDPNENGNPYSKDGIITFWRWPEEQQIAFLTSKNYNFIANEASIGEHMPIHKNIAYITILRDPIDRIASQFYHQKEFGGGLFRFEQNKNLNFCEFILHENFSHVIWKNNFLIRCFNQENLKSVTRKELIIATNRINQFRYVFFLDTLENDIGKMSSFGWNTVDSHKNRMGTSRNSDARNELANNKEALDKILKLNQLDIEFYNHVKNNFRN